MKQNKISNHESYNKKHAPDFNKKKSRIALGLEHICENAPKINSGPNKKERMNYKIQQR